MESLIGSHLAQLGAGGIFALLILVVVLKYVSRKSSNGMTTMHYLETVVVPKIDKLQTDHNALKVTVATLSTRFDALIEQINNKGV